MRKKADRLTRYYWDYDYNVLIIADFHIDSSPFTIEGKEIDFRILCELICEAGKNADVIIFNGDTFDYIEIKNKKRLEEQKEILFETLYKHGLWNKTKFIKGNHDSSEEIYQWKMPVQVYDHLKLMVEPHKEVIIAHGHNMGMEKQGLMEGFTDEKVRKWRKNIYYKIDGKEFWLKDVLIVGHAHEGYVNRDEHTLGVPCLRKMLATGNYHSLGIFGIYSISVNPEKFTHHWNITLTTPESFGKLR